jgi:hypothetical protein
MNSDVCDFVPHCHCGAVREHHGVPRIRGVPLLPGPIRRVPRIEEQTTIRHERAAKVSEGVGPLGVRHHELRHMARHHRHIERATRSRSRGPDHPAHGIRPRLASGRIDRRGCGIDAGHDMAGPGQSERESPRSTAQVEYARARSLAHRGQEEVVFPRPREGSVIHRNKVFVVELTIAHTVTVATAPVLWNAVDVDHMAEGV